MILYRVVSRGVCLMETRDRTLARDIAASVKADVWAVDTESAYDRSYTRRLWWAMAIVCGVYLLAVVTGHW